MWIAEWKADGYRSVLWRVGCNLNLVAPRLIRDSQPFWGKIVASAGAGPPPVSPKKLTSQTLAEAVSYCLTPEANAAAKTIATKMKAESGVAAAIQSFYGNLPQHKMACSILPDQSAIWTYKRKKLNLSLSKRAAAILIDSAEIEKKRLRT